MTKIGQPFMFVFISFKTRQNSLNTIFISGLYEEKLIKNSLTCKVLVVFFFYYCLLIAVLVLANIHQLRYSILDKKKYYFYRQFVTKNAMGI